MPFPPSKGKAHLQGWYASTPKLIIVSEVVELVRHFAYLRAMVSYSGSVYDKNSVDFYQLSSVVAYARCSSANQKTGILHNSFLS